MEEVTTQLTSLELESKTQIEEPKSKSKSKKPPAFKTNIVEHHSKDGINHTYNWLKNLSVTKNKDNESKYRNMMFHNKALTKLASLYIWPNEKEYTECMGGIEAVFPFIPSQMRDNKDVVCYCIGDGHRPQLAALVAGITKWARVFWYCIIKSII